MRFLRIVDTHVLIVAALAVLATGLSIRMGVRAALPSELITVAIVLPIVFSINAAYQRREEALAALGAVRAALTAVYYAHREVKPGDPSHGERAARLGQALYSGVRDTLRCPPSVREDALGRVTAAFSGLFASTEALRAAGMPGAEISDIRSNLANALTNFEKVRAIVEYRTPSLMRSFSKLHLNVFPILFAPAYAQLAYEYGAPYGYGVALAFAVVLVGLDNIQDSLENPFDGEGADDVRLEAALLWRPEGCEAVDPASC